MDAGYLPAAERVGRALGVPRVFLSTRLLGPPRMVRSGDTVVVPENSRVFATAAIARPERFFADLTCRRNGRSSARCRFAITISSRARDVAQIAAAAKASSAAIVLTTDKDAVRFAVCDLTNLPIAAVPLVGHRRADRRVPHVAFRTCVAGGTPAVRHWLEYVAVRALVAMVAHDALRP